MSAIDDLRKLNADWAAIETWLKGPARHYVSDGDRSDPGKLVGEGSVLNLGRLPDAVREPVMSDIEDVVRTLARKHYKWAREKLVDAARADAQKLIDELGPAPVAVQVPE